MRSIDNGRSTSGEGTGARGERARGRSSGRVLGSISLLAVAITLAGCEGDNLFAGDSPELLPRVMGLSAPNGAVAGDTISVRVDAFAPHGVAQIVVSLEGAVSNDTIVDVLPVRSQVSQTIRVPVPPLLSDTLLTVRASVTDALGNVSLGRTTEVVAFGPPDVTSISGPASARAGDVVSVEVKVSGARRVSRVDYQVRGALTQDTSIVVSPALHDVTQTLLLQVPFVVQDTMLVVSVSARDESGFSSAPESKLIPLSVDPPVLTLTVPAQARAGDNFEVKIAATGLRKVSQIRVSLRDAFVDDVIVPVDPQRSDLSQTISIALPGAIMCAVPACAGRNLAVGVYAIDIGGAISATKSDTVFVPLGPPTIVGVQAPAGVFNDQPVDLWINAQGPRPLSHIVVWWSGAVVGQQSYAVAQLPPIYQVDHPARITIPAAPLSEALVVDVWAVDVAGEKSAPVRSVVSVTIDSTSASLSMSAAPQAPAVAELDAGVLDALREGGPPAALLALRQRPLASKRDWRTATR